MSSFQLNQFQLRNIKTQVGSLGYKMIADRLLVEAINMIVVLFLQ